MDKSTSNENFGKCDSSTSTSEFRRVRNVNWTASPEKETFRTVVINYKIGQKKSSQQTDLAANSRIPGPIKCNNSPRSTWREELAKISPNNIGKAASNEELVRTSAFEFGSDLNLRQLYGDSMQELRDCVIEEKTENKGNAAVLSLTLKTFTELPKEEKEIPKIASMEKEIKVVEVGQGVAFPKTLTFIELPKEEKEIPKIASKEKEIKVEEVGQGVAFPKTLTFIELPKEEKEIPKIASKEKEIEVEEVGQGLAFPKTLAVATYDDAEIIIISDDEEDNEVQNKKTQVTAIAESPLKLEKHSSQTKATSTSHQFVDDKILPVDSMETIEEKLKIKVTMSEPVKRAAVAGEKSSPDPDLLKIRKTPLSSYKQRQLELHRHRIEVEQKRLEVLELKLARERDEMLREQILFEKELELKAWQMRQLKKF